MNVHQHLFLLSIISVTIRYKVLSQECTAVRLSNPSQRKIMRVGVLANRGYETAYNDFNPTFATYLSHTVGKQFDPPVHWDIVPVEMTEAIDVFSSKKVDFFFSNPNVYSCVDSEVGAVSLVTLINRRVVGGKANDLTHFGGVIFTQKDNDEINTIYDIADKKVGLLSMSSLGAAQMQFRELLGYHIHYLQDPKQILFMATQPNIITAVLKGQVEVGFVRTDQLERYTDPTTGEPLDLNKIKVIRVVEDTTTEDGKPFPFEVSTRLYPEWNVASTGRTSPDVLEAVQIALLRLSDHATVAPPLLDCYEANKCADLFNSSQVQECKDVCFDSLPPSAFKRCDTTAELALVAHEAQIMGNYAGFQLSMSYMELRNMQEATGYIETNKETGIKRCVRQDELADAVVCPPGFLKRENDKIATRCEDNGLDCYGFECICSPCYQCSEVDPSLVPNHDGECVCKAMTVQIGSGCVELHVLLLSTLAPLCFLIVLGVSIYVGHKRKQADAIWMVEPSELMYDEPPRVLGRGTFGMILQAQYRGTKVAVKRVLPPHDSSRSSTAGSISRAGARLFSLILSRKNKRSGIINTSPPERKQSSSVNLDLPMGVSSSGAIKVGKNPKIGSKFSHFDFVSRTVAANGQRNAVSVASSNSDDALSSNVGLASKDGLVSSRSSYRASKSRYTNNSRSLPSGAGGLFSWKLTRNDYAKRQRDFIEEMRLISKLRHPCITTVMGAVISPGMEPLLVMELMELGSLHDLLHNKTMVMDGELMLPILRDIAQGVRFLHSAMPQIVHGDLKAHNVLVDSRFRAKVADFGLSHKDFSRRSVATGTPFWMAPELLRGEASNTTASDIYALGVLLYEFFTRKDPYEGEDAKAVLQQVADRRYYKRPPIPTSCPTEVQELMTACFRDAPTMRPTAEEVDMRIEMLNVDNLEQGCSLFEKNKVKAKKGVNTEELLFQLFPKHVAEALQEGRKVKPTSYECVTVFFSDIVNYTEISSGLTPEKVTNLLDRLYSKFDELCGVHEVFKVETVGDAFMAVTNLAQKQPNQTSIISKFAFDAIQAASETKVDEDDASKGYLQIRVGFHSGPVVAHVVGLRTPRYSVIGDTVNTASRMESNSLPNRIHCSKGSAILLREESSSGITLTRRGKIAVKGKGSMVTYWVSRDGDPTREVSFGELSENPPNESDHTDGASGNSEGQYTAETQISVDLSNDSDSQEDSSGDIEASDQNRNSDPAKREVALAPLYDYFKEEGNKNDAKEPTMNEFFV